MYNGVWLGSKHSSEFNLVLSNKDIPFPDIKKHIIEIPCADGVIDLSTALTGRINYKNRKIVMNFTYLGLLDNLQSDMSNIADYLHGNNIKITFDNDSDYYYYGMAEIDKYSSNVKKKTVSIIADVYPYKYEKKSSNEDWLWDEFNFNDGIIREYKNIVVNGTKTVNIIGRKMPVTPIIYTNAKMNIEYNNIIYALNNTKNEISELTTKEGDNIYTFSGKGTISIEYRGGRL